MSTEFKPSTLCVTITGIAEREKILAKAANLEVSQFIEPPSRLCYTEFARTEKSRRTRWRPSLERTDKKTYGGFLMAPKSAIDILKGALLLEKRGRALYDLAFRDCENPAMKSLFEMLVNEEIQHMEFLEKQFTLARDDKPLNISALDAPNTKSADCVVSKEIIKHVSAAGSEAALISAGLDFEKKAVEFYSLHATDAGSNEEREIYKMLAQWERIHLYMLADLETEIQQEAWSDNNFWPY